MEKIVMEIFAERGIYLDMCVFNLRLIFFPGMEFIFIISLRFSAFIFFVFLEMSKAIGDSKLLEKRIPRSAKWSNVRGRVDTGTEAL